MRLYYRVCQILAQGCYILLTHGRVFGTRRVPRTGGAILACNHQSFFDPVLAALALPRECDFMARDTLFQHPWFRRLIVSLNAFPIRRGEADVAAIKESLRRLRNGRIIAAFPEGTRTEDGRIGPLLPGIGAIAKKAGVPIIPVLIEGAYEAWPRHQKLPGRAQITVVYGEPIPPYQAATMRPDELVCELRYRLLRMQDAERRRRGLRPLQYGEACAADAG